MTEPLIELTKGLEAIEFGQLCDYLAEHTPYNETTLFLHKLHWPPANENWVEHLKQLYNNDQDFPDLLKDFKKKDILNQDTALIATFKKWGADGSLICFARSKGIRTHKLLPQSAWAFADFDMKSRVLKIGDQDEFQDLVFFLAEVIPLDHALLAYAQKANEPSLSALSSQDGTGRGDHVFEPKKSGAPGRPTSMHLIKMEFERRVQAGHLEESNSKQSVALAEWLRDNYPNAPSATAKTIANNLRSAYNTATKPPSAPA